MVILGSQQLIARKTYLSDYDDEGAYGHVALGRSFALEMGSAIPTADQRLGKHYCRWCFTQAKFRTGSIDIQGEININTGSDFIAQYTTRQEYKHADALPEYDPEWIKLLNLSP